MYARAVDDAALELRDLRRDEWGDIGLAGLALGLAVGAAELYPVLALPLFIGGLVIGGRGVRALWRRWDLVDRLAGDPDAHVISEVRAYAERETTMDRRRTFAALIRGRLREPVELALDPVSAVACARLLSDVTGSSLLNPAFSPEDLRSRVHQIRCGFSCRRIAA